MKRDGEGVSADALAAEPTPGALHALPLDDSRIDPELDSRLDSLAPDTRFSGSESRLEALHLRKSYGSRMVVKDVSLAVQKGEVVGLLGPNGAGKTTSFYMIVGLVRSDGGDIRSTVSRSGTCRSIGGRGSGCLICRRKRRSFAS